LGDAKHIFQKYMPDNAMGEEFKTHKPFSDSELRSLEKS
jgi:hypothetical protein